MQELLAKFQSVLRADGEFASKLNIVPGSPAKAVYTNHISFVQRVLYPAAFVYIETGGQYGSVVIAETMVVTLDVWTEELLPADLAGSGLAEGAGGAWDLYRRGRLLLHEAQKRPPGYLSVPGVYALAYCAEQPGAVGAPFVEDQKLYHVMTRFLVHIIADDMRLGTPT